MKKCPRCLQERDLTEFWKQNRAKDGLQSACKHCMRKARTSDEYKDAYRKYISERIRKAPGVLREDYDRLLAEQLGVCKICGEPPTGDSNQRRVHLCVDHDHVTDEVRGLLCDWCNTGLARFRDDPKLLLSAIRYINSENPRPTLLYSKVKPHREGRKPPSQEKNDARLSRKKSRSTVSRAKNLPY